MNERGEGNKSLLWIILVAVVVFLLLLVTGVIDFSSEGELEAPEVEVEGGALPDIDADVADINVGTEEVTVEVPEVDVDAADAEAEDDD